MKQDTVTEIMTDRFLKVWDYTVLAEMWSTGALAQFLW